MRNLKILGLALVAALAFSAMAASAASATTAVVTPGHHIEGLFGEDGVGGNELTGAVGFACPTAHYEGTTTTSTITLEPTFEECELSVGAADNHNQRLCLQTDNGRTSQRDGRSRQTHRARGPRGPKDSKVTDPTDGPLGNQGTLTSITSTLAGHYVTTGPFILPHDGPVPSPVA